MVVNILLVEDDKEQANLFVQVLRLSGYTVETTTNATEAQAQLSAQQFALLLADWDLAGDMQGDALILWAKTQHPEIKAILFSNHPQVDEIASTCGADAAFRKTDGIIQLRQLVAQLVPLHADHL